MVTIQIQELEEDPAEVMRHVRRGEIVELMEGEIKVARITPTQITPMGRSYSEEEGRAFLAKLDQMAEEIGRYWPEGVSAVDAIRDVRD